MKNYSENIFHCFLVLFSKGVQLAGIKNKFFEFNLLDKYLSQKHEILSNKRKILIILKKLRSS